MPLLGNGVLSSTDFIKKIYNILSGIGNESQNCSRNFLRIKAQKKQSAIPAMLGVLDIFISPDSNTAPMNDKAHTLDTDSAEKHSRQKCSKLVSNKSTIGGHHMKNSI